MHISNCQNRNCCTQNGKVTRLNETVEQKMFHEIRAFVQKNKIQGII